jgi:hypothetical protein
MPLHAVTCRYMPLHAVTCRYMPLHAVRTAARPPVAGRCVVLGSPNMDFRTRAMTWVNGGETTVGKFSASAGGSAANVAVTLAQLGVESQMVGRVGDDDMGQVHPARSLQRVPFVDGAAACPFCGRCCSVSLLWQVLKQQLEMLELDKLDCTRIIESHETTTGVSGE